MFNKNFAYVLKSLVTIRMNEIFSCLAFYGQRLIFLFGNRNKVKTSSVKGSGEDEIQTNFLNSDIYDEFYPVLACDHSQIIILYTSYITQVYLRLILFKKYIVTFKIWMYNWRMVIANLGQVSGSVRKLRTNRMI